MQSIIIFFSILIFNTCFIFSQEIKFTNGHKTLTLLENQKFRLEWGEGLLFFNLSGSYKENNGVVEFIRNDIFSINYLFEDSITQYGESQIFIYQVMKHSSFLTFQKLDHSFFDFHQGIDFERNNFIDDKRKLISLKRKDLTLNFDFQNDNFAPEKKTIIIGLNYPNFLIPHQSFEGKFSKKRKEIVLLKVWENEEVVFRQQK